jgi:hypothetical protein
MHLPLTQLAQAMAYAQEDSGPSAAAGAAAGIIGGIMALVYLVIIALVVIGLWKVFVKAGQPGWAAIVPIYNIVILLQIVGRPVWWVILMLIPCVSLVVAILVMLDLAKCFGKSQGFAIGLILLGFIFVPILGFDDSRYLGPQAGK